MEAKNLGGNAMHDLTIIFTTIAACSASVVAILGGLIASKLISLNTERDEIQTRLLEISNEIAFHQKEKDCAQTELDEDDALDFIVENIAKVIDESTLDTAYREENRPRIEKDVLRPYWTKAQNILHLLYDDMEQHKGEEDYPENDDKIPVTVVQALKGNFEYDICKEIVQYFNAHSGGFSNILGSISTHQLPRVTSGLWYSKTQERVNNSQYQIDWLAVQQRQLATRKNALKHPKGMKIGFILFSAFSLTNIVLPLILSPFLTKSLIVFNVVKLSAIGLFVVGMTAMLAYLIYLLRWNKDSGIENQ